MNKRNTALFSGLTVIVVAIVVIVVTALFNSVSFKRNLKSTVSNYTGGLNRTVTVYDYGGKPIETWSGKFDISETENASSFKMEL